MNKNLRKAVIAGNWKMNKTRTEAAELVKQLHDNGVAGNDNVQVVVCVPFTNLETALNATKGTSIKVGAQNVHFEKSGAFTGEISGAMLKELGVEYVIIGHSERRQYFGETDETVNWRTKSALESGLTPIMCIGELLSERESGITEEILSSQIKLDLAGFTAEQVKNTIIAYEPVWAIGTGRTATAEQAQEVHAFIRKTINDKYGEQVAQNTTILYGGSCNENNAKELFACPDIDGGLIGGASLVADKFVKIVTAF